ncbi:hypothetical protein [aff. Roholtiella sp. LEGE 12411]|uniref:hypothetical protein n=1 Tax=aff. Roholtiella sp. LEGE 12411 TaxID=1828822 RepID=UPI00187FDE3D|nr:hypothetical protein [aff. Roholtiella sp. LEGE 12411]MBE9035204.1 hypothetical protein [aff. Roholtiella sp. LEGE 12411]
MLSNVFGFKKKKLTWFTWGKELRLGLLFTLSFFLILNGSQVQAAAPTAPGGGCTGWLCGPKNTIVAAFPGGAQIINTGFIMMQALIVAILVGIAAITINKIAAREDYGAPMATFFGTVLVLLVINFLAGYVVGN